MRLGLEQENHAALQPAVLTEKQRIDWVLLGLIGVLASLGLVMVFSASVAQAERILEDATYYGRLQGIYLCLGFLAALIMWRTPLDLFEEYGPALLCLGFVLLFLVLLPFIGKRSSFTWRVTLFAKAIRFKKMYLYFWCRLA